jgi:hypothetical protein
MQIIVAMIIISQSLSDNLSRGSIQAILHSVTVIVRSSVGLAIMETTKQETSAETLSIS